MESSFLKGRSATAVMAAQARSSENQVSRGSTGYPANPGIGDARHLVKDATKRDLRALGAALRLYRGERSLASVATAAGTKTSQLAAFEKGKKVPRPATLGRLVNALAVTGAEVDALADLLGLAPELLDRTADPACFDALKRGVRWAALFRSAEEDLLPFLRPLLAGVPQPWNTPDAEADREAAALWARLQPYSAAERRALVEEGVEYQVWGLSRLLCDVSIEAAADEPAEALEIARLAERIALLVAGSDALRYRLAGYCAFHVSSASRAGGSLPAADEDLRRAEVLWSAGAVGDPGERLAEARVLGLKASLRREQRHLQEALDLLDEALALDRGGLRAHLLINRARTLEEMGKYDEAIATLFQASPYIDAEREPRLLLIQRFNLNVNFCRLERYADADRLFGEMEALAPRAARGLANVRIAWLRGWIAAGMGRLGEAEAALGAVREELLVRAIGYDAALASLDLAKLYLQQGRTAEVKSLAGQMVTIFEEQGVHREAMASVRLFQEAADRERASVELVRRLADYLRRARHDAALRFTG